MQARHALNRRSAQSSVEGFLIHYAGGYGCVQPWPLFGHASLEDHWQGLAQGVSLPLTERAMSCARLDGAARAAGLSWWTGVAVPLSHATVTDLCDDVDGEFTHAKLKASVREMDDLIAWAERNPACALRLDFNEVPSVTEMDDWLARLPQRVRERIDWLEDPFAFDAAAWRSWQKHSGLRLALDRGLSETSASAEWVSIWKPAWQDLPRAIPVESVVVTSAMDHPVGQAWAAFCAAQAGVKQVCGLRTDHLFAPDDFLERMGPWCPAWPDLSGTGMGFDDLLEKIPWTRIR